LSENFNTEHVGDYFFGFALEIGVHEGDVVIGDDDVAEGGEAFFYSLGRMSATGFLFLVCAVILDCEAGGIPVSSLHRVMSCVDVGVLGLLCWLVLRGLFGFCAGTRHQHLPFHSFLTCV
jgi:hypothetical protein